MFDRKKKASNSSRCSFVDGYRCPGPLESVSVGSLSSLLDFLPKVHGEGGHGVGGQDDDGAAHELRGGAAAGREPPALPVQVRVCRLHGVREGLHASGREGALHFLFSDFAVVVPCHPR